MQRHGGRDCNSSGTAWLYSSTCAVACTGAGLCTGACTPGATRCNGKSVETCAPSGTAWSNTQSCASTFCYSGQCALNGLDVTLPTNRDGEVIVDGPVVVRSGASLTSPAGDSTIRAKSIVVENGASIAVSPTGTTNGPAQQGYGTGGGHGEPGTGGSAAPSYIGAAFGSSIDAIVSKGGTGAKGYAGNGGAAGNGGGVLRLIASDTISIAGTVTAIGQNGAPGGSGSGGGGGGGGGGVLLAADKVDITGSVSAAPGSGGGTGAGSWTGGNGGRGRVKVLSGSTRTGAGTLTGIVTDGLLPPLTVTSTTHPDSSLVYNDDFAKIELSWDRSFPSRQGYYQAVNTAASFVPTPANATFLAVENVVIPRSSLVAGQNYFHIDSVNAASVVGTVETGFLVKINTTPPTITSSSHPSSTTWSATPDAFFQWSFPVADDNVKGAFYVLDHDMATPSRPPRAPSRQSRRSSSS